MQLCPKLLQNWRNEIAGTACMMQPNIQTYMHRKAGWLVGWLAGWLVGWLAGWLGLHSWKLPLPPPKCRVCPTPVLTNAFCLAALGQLCIDHAAAVEHTHQLVTRRLRSISSISSISRRDSKTLRTKEACAQAHSHAAIQYFHPTPPVHVYMFEQTPHTPPPNRPPATTPTSTPPT
jgi:hypothetical protein